MKRLRTGLTEQDIQSRYEVIPVAQQENLKPRQSIHEHFSKGRTLRALYVALTDRTAPRELNALHNLVIRFWWDEDKPGDSKTPPDIELPLSTFFGTGFERNSYTSFPMGTALWTEFPAVHAQGAQWMYCYFPMPFHKNARIEIQNETRSTVGLLTYMLVDRKSPPKNALHFRAAYMKVDPAEDSRLSLLNARGPGRVVGVVLNVDCPRRDWWGAGSHHLTVDGAVSSGAGTDGYFGLIPGLASTQGPFHGATLVSEVGKNSMYRWHLLDSMDFTRRLTLDLDNQQKNARNDVYYNSIVYWYGQKAKTNGSALSDEDLALPGLRFPGSVEVETCVVTPKWGNVLQEKYARGAALSGKAGAVITSREPLEMKLPAPKTGRYRLKLRLLSSYTFDTIRVTLKGGEEIGVLTYDRATDGMYTVGEVTLQEGDNRIVTQVAGRLSPRLDCWILEPMN